jgi:hypothetical protein
MNADDLGSWLVVYEKNGEVVQCEASDESRVDAAVSAWIDGGKRTDTILHLTMAGGTAPYSVLASRIASWWVSSPEHRRDNHRRLQLQKEETRAFKSELGIAWSEEDQ